ncbi:MAG: ArsA-related P-loop ATPase [Acidimicrobiia bacterium]
MDLGAQIAGSRAVIVAGKGGVGKTTVTAALAVAAANAGAEVLIAQVDARPGLAEAFGATTIRYEEIALRPRIRARALAPDDALVEYLEDHGLRRIARTLARTGALDVVATAVPGIRDLLVLGKIKQLERAGTADLIIVDAPAAGHARTFLTSAIGLAEAARVGPIRQQATEVCEMLSDAARASLILVTLPESTPVTECVETAYDLEDRVGIALGPVVVNACAPDQRTLDGRWPHVRATTTEQVLADAAAAEVRLDDLPTLVDACAYHDGLVQQQREQVDRLTRLLPLPQIRLPLIAGPMDPDALDALAACIPFEKQP